MIESQFLLIGATDVDSQVKEEFKKWYDKEHILRLLNVQGVLSAQ
jgi:hypothetical protein